MQYLPGALETSATLAERAVWDFLVSRFSLLTGVCGFKIPSVGVPDEGDIPSFILITTKGGLLIVDVVDERITTATEDNFWTYDGGQLFSRDIVLDRFEVAIKNRLFQDSSLVDRRRNDLRFPVQKLLVFYRTLADELTPLLTADAIVNRYADRNSWQQSIAEILEDSPTSLSQDFFDRIVSGLDGTNALLPRRERTAIQEPRTKRDFLELSRAQIFKLDDEQRQVSLQLPDGPQRIRGLAGTGKTVILSLKAALTHKAQPDFRILYLFNTKSLYDIVRSHISKYFIPETQREPNWSRLDVLHAWGGASLKGLYSELCRRYGLRALTFDEIRDERDQLSVLYRHVLPEAKRDPEALYDLALIDEAQDFPPAVFETLYYITKQPKRIVWAYDEFQTLSDLRIREPDEMFGLNDEGEPNISRSALSGYYSKTVKKDFVLPNSYRTTRVALLTAHGLALGLKNAHGFIDMIDDRATWTALGYTVEEPPADKLKTGDNVVILRPDEHSRNGLESTLRKFQHPDLDLVKVAAFPAEADEIAAVAKEINKLVTVDGIAPEEIIVITLNTRRARSKLTGLRKALTAHNVSSITPGIFERADIFRQEGCVTLVSPFRAKGNESDVAFVLDAQEAVRDLTFRARNFLFVSITRSRGWCYVTGSGPSMSELADEIQAILAEYPRFLFTFPDDKDIKRRRLILSLPDDQSKGVQDALERIARENPELFKEFIRQRQELFSES